MKFVKVQNRTEGLCVGARVFSCGHGVNSVSPYVRPVLSCDSCDSILATSGYKSKLREEHWPLPLLHDDHSSGSLHKLYK